MTAATVGLRAAPSRSHPPLRLQIGELARRSIVRILRQPAAIVPATLFPLILLAINAAGLDSATDLPGFPTDSYITFALAFAFLQAGVFAVIGAGQNLAEDRENGFFNRLQLTPIRPSALLAGQLAGTLVLGVLQAVTYIAIGLLAGADDRGRGPRRAGDDRALGRDHARLRLDRPVRGHASEVSRVGAGHLPPAVRLPLPQLDEPAPGPDPDRLVPDRRDLQPGQLHDRGHPQPADRGLGRRGAGARLRLRARDPRRRARRRIPLAALAGWSGRDGAALHLGRPGPELGACCASCSPTRRCSCRRC